MIFVTTVGPVATDETEQWIALATGGTTTMKVAATRAEAVKLLVSALPVGAPVTCDESLSDVASTFGWKPGPIPDEVNDSAAMLATTTFHGDTFRKLTDPDAIFSLLDATAAFARARPWETFEGSPLELKLTGALTGTRYADVYGPDADEGHGLVLYDTLADLARFRDASEAGELERAHAVDCLSCLVTFEPGAISDAMKRSFDIAFQPQIDLFKNGKPQPLRADDARLLTAALRAVTSVVPGATESSGSCSLLGKRVDATFTVPESAQTDPLQHEFFLRLGELALATPGWSPVDPTHEDFPLLHLIALVTRPVSGKTIAARLLESQGKAELRTLLESAMGGWITLVELEAHGEDDAAALHDLLLDEPITVQSKAFARVRAHEVLVVWLTRLDGELRVAACKRRAIPLEEALSLRDELRSRGPLTREGLRTPELIDALLLGVRTKETQRKPEPAPTNTDGDPIFLGADEYSLEVDGDAMDRLLAAQPELIEGEESVFRLTRRGNPQHPAWRRTEVATVIVDAKRLSIEANSEKRLDFARQWLERVAGHRVTFLERGPMPDPLASSDLDFEPIPYGPWVDVLGTVEFRSTWLARGTKENRREAHLAIAEVESETETDVDAIDVRRAVGINWRGEWIGPDAQWLALGAGIPMSLVLQTLAAPMLDELEGDELATVADAIRLAWAAWHVAREPGSAADAAAIAWRRLEPAGTKRPEVGAPLSASLQVGSPNAELIRSSLPWAIERSRLLFPLDRRTVQEVHLMNSIEGLSCEAVWTPEGLPELVARGYRLGDEPCHRYGDLTLDDGFAWRETPPAWRAELVADDLRSVGAFDDDFLGQVARCVELEDALLERQDERLRAACSLLEERTGLSHVAAVRTLSELAKRGASFNEAPGAAVERLLALQSLADG